MGRLSKEQAVVKANKAFVDYYNGSITVDKCYEIVLDRDVRSKLDGWKPPDPWDVLGRSGEVTKSPTKRKPLGERIAIRREKARARKPFVIFRD